MTDEAKALVERLREVGRDGVWKSGRNPATAHPMCIEAADLIETQAREIERLREALAHYAAWGVVCPQTDDAIREDGGDLARAALKGTDHDPAQIEGQEA